MDDDYDMYEDYEEMYANPNPYIAGGDLWQEENEQLGMTTLDVWNLCVIPSVNDGILHSVHLLLGCLVFRLTTQLVQLPPLACHAVSAASGLLDLHHFFQTMTYFILAFATFMYFILFAVFRYLKKWKGAVTISHKFNLHHYAYCQSSGDGCSPASSSSISARGLLAPAGASGGETSKLQENALDTLLDELQTFARPPSDRHGSIDASTPNPQNQASGTLRRLHSYPSLDSSSPVRSSPISRLQVLEDSKPPSLPERSKVPPPPPPRTSSRSPLVSPTSPPRLAPRGSTGGTLLLRRKREPQGEQDGNSGKPLSSNSSSSESINSQEGLRGSEALEQRHQELLRRQRQLQEQYAQLQQLQRNVRLPQAPELKKTGSESNLLRGLNLSAAPTSGSLTHLAPTSIVPIVMPSSQQHTLAHSSGSSKIYETDIL